MQPKKNKIVFGPHGSYEKKYRLEKAISTDKEIERITGLAEMLRQKESANVKSSGK